MPAGTRILPRGGTAAAWTSANPVLLAKELGVETNTGRSKIGDGTTAWNALAYTADAVGSVAAIPADGAAGTPSLRTIGSGAGQAGSGAVVAQNQTDIAANVAAIALKAPLASPALSGTPTTPTAGAGTNTTQIASTAFVATVVATIDGGTP